MKKCCIMTAVCAALAFASRGFYSYTKEKKMTLRKFVVKAAVLCALLSLSGCASIFTQLTAGKVVFDESIPQEQTAKVVFGRPIHVLEYNGIGVEDSWYRNGKYRLNTVTLPAGETTILFDYYLSFTTGTSLYSTTYTATGEQITLRFDFEAGQDYTVTSYTKPITKGIFVTNWEYGVAIWDRAIPSGDSGNIDKSIESWKLGSF